YRILIDDRCDTAILKTEYRLGRGASGLLGKYLPHKYAARIRSLEGQAFDQKDQLIQALERVVGPRRYSLVKDRLPDLVVEILCPERINITEEWRYPEDRRRTGPGSGYLADVMVERGMNAPTIENSRARFYFTEKGWRTVGRHVAAEAKRLGHHVQVLKQKNPEPSRIVYADALQLAILPPRSLAGAHGD
ncbi:MAG TPA: hypothetical protein VFA87_02280, partial [Rhizomicrobium sp.]|nr:hypothetical protein [Rhizomicrobium sp.]